MEVTGGLNLLKIHAIITFKRQSRFPAFLENTEALAI